LAVAFYQSGKAIDGLMGVATAFERQAHEIAAGQSRLWVKEPVSQRRMADRQSVLV
jgi:hypothetical protein